MLLVRLACRTTKFSVLVQTRRIGYDATELTFAGVHFLQFDMHIIFCESSRGKLSPAAPAADFLRVSETYVPPPTTSKAYIQQ